MFREYFKPLIVLTFICLFFAAALAAVNNVTEPLITAAAIERTNEAMALIIPDADGFEEISFDGDLGDGLVKEAYRATNGVGYVFTPRRTGTAGLSGLSAPLTPTVKSLKRLRFRIPKLWVSGLLLSSSPSLGGLRAPIIR